MRYIISINTIFLILLFGCEKESFTNNIVEDVFFPVDNNSKPIAGNISLLSIKSNSATINWQSAFDADGDELYYNLYFNDRLININGVVDNLFTFTDLKPETHYKGVLQVTDSIASPIQIQFEFTTIKYFLQFNKLITTQIPSNKILNTSDGGYLYFGDFRYKDLNVTSVTKIDSLGFIEWSKNLLDQSYGDRDPFALAETLDAYYLTINNFLIKTDKAGNIRWNKQFRIDSPVRITSMFAEENNYLICAGWFFSENSKPQGVVLKIDMEGNVVNKKIISNALHTIKPLGSNKYSILSSYVYDNKKAQISVHILDKDFKQLFSKEYSDNYYNFPEELICTKDNEIILVSNCWDNRDIASIRIIKISSSGDILWEKRLSFGGMNSYLRDVILNKEGEIVFVGYNEFGNHNCAALIVEMDNSGNILSKKTFSPNSMDFLWQFKKIDQTSDGGYFINGIKSFIWYGPGEKGVWLLKTDSNFNFIEP